MDSVMTTRRMSLGPLPALLAAAVLLTGCVAVPAGSPTPRPNQAATSAPPAPDVPPTGVPQRRTAAPASRPGPARVQPQQHRPAPDRRPAVRPRTRGSVPQMRALCRSAGGVVSAAVSQLCRQAYGR
ncbi:hypothetical protein [Streptomyces cyaneofuscatus]|uniref:hypothetical protein n=2 Tax=Streptomyces cyaneofuscatus TaxID=66883 RepID=UPI003431B571